MVCLKTMAVCDAESHGGHFPYFIIRNLRILTTTFNWRYSGTIVYQKPTFFALAIQYVLCQWNWETQLLNHMEWLLYLAPERERIRLVLATSLIASEYLFFFSINVSPIRFCEETMLLKVTSKCSG